MQAINLEAFFYFFSYYSTAAILNRGDLRFLGGHRGNDHIIIEHAKVKDVKKKSFLQELMIEKRLRTTGLQLTQNYYLST